jgi:hypothetical protein
VEAPSIVCNELLHLVLIGFVAALAFEACLIERIHDDPVDFGWIKFSPAIGTLFTLNHPRFNAGCAFK